jgi:hypothetical protein
MVLRLRVASPGGWKNAKCLGQVSKDKETGVVADPWFDEDDQSEAVNFCNGEADGVVCPIRHDCLIFALVNNERQGVWGGMGERDRKALRKISPWKARQAINPDWHWMEPGQAVAQLKPSQRKELDDDPEDD